MFLKVFVLSLVIGSLIQPIPASAQAEDAVSRWGLPDDPLGNRIAQFLEVIRRDDEALTREFVENGLAQSFLEMGPVEMHMEQFASIRNQLGAFEVEDIMLHGPDRGELVLRAASGDRILLSMEIEEIDPHRLVGIGLSPYDEELEVPGFANLGEVGEYLGELAAANKFSGVVLVKQGEETPFLEAYGMANKHLGIQNTSDTPFNVGSITKSFTAVAVLQLVESGKIDLDDLLGKYFLEFPATIGNSVTVRQLLAMKSGFGDYFGSREFREQRADIRSIDDYIQIFKGFDLDFKPGTDRRYSNVGYVILGGIIEKASGMTYFDYVQKNIFDAAGMAGSSFPEYAGDGIAMGYTNDGDSGRRDYSEDYLGFFTPLGNPSGGSFSTAEDLWRFNMLLLWDRLLNKEHTKLLLNFFEEGGERRARYGVAGGAPGVSTVSFTDRDLETTVIVLSNYDEPLGERIGQAIFKMLTN
jgi:CubicO group peptidase (beta-lactamase class C family)